jgi:hypothetical protein
MTERMGGILCSHALRHGIEVIDAPRRPPLAYNIPESTIRSIIEQRPINVVDIVFLLRNWQIRDLPAELWTCALEDDKVLSELLHHVPDKVRALRTVISDTSETLYERLCQTGRFSLIPSSIVISTGTGMIALHYACKALDYRYVLSMTQHPNLFMHRDAAGFTPLDYLVQSTVERGSDKALQTTIMVAGRLPDYITKMVTLSDGAPESLQRALRITT